MAVVEVEAGAVAEAVVEAVVAAAFGQAGVVGTAGVAAAFDQAGVVGTAEGSAAAVDLSAGPHSCRNYQRIQSPQQSLCSNCYCHCWGTEENRGFVESAETVGLAGIEGLEVVETAGNQAALGTVVVSESQEH